MSQRIVRSQEEERTGVKEPELAEGTEATAEAEPGEGEPVCAYGVEVVELLEMEPMEAGTRRPRRRVPWNKYASAAFMLAFVLGIANAGASLYLSSLVVSPAELLEGHSCELSGEVQDIAGHPIPNATVVVTDTTRSAFSNRDGWYILKGLPPGNHRVEATAEGYNTMSVRTDLQPDLLNIVDFTLEKGGEDVSADEPAAPDFSQAASSYQWAVPILVLFSVCALAAALLSLRRKDRWRTTAILGALGALSFGFGAGSALAIAGVALTALALPEAEPLPLKKLRVGVSYPSKGPVGRRAGAPKPARALHEPHEHVFAARGPMTLEPVGEAEGAPSSLERVPAAEGAAPELPMVPAAETEDGESAAARPPALKDRTADGELDANVAPPRQAAQGPAPAPRPKRLVRRSIKGKLLCYICVEEIAAGSAYIRCTCGKSVHPRCLNEPRCPCCGEAFGRAAAR
jgi:hypothetical protein